MKTMHTDLFPETLLVNLDHGHSFTTSLKVATHFNKQHLHVLRSIRALMNDLNESNFGFIERNFIASDYTDSRGRAKPSYHLSRDAFSLLAMAFTGREALVWKIKFLEAFNAMEAQLHAKRDLYVGALDILRPALRITTERTEAGQDRTSIASVIGKSCASVTYNRKQAKRLGLLAHGCNKAHRAGPAA